MHEWNTVCSYNVRHIVKKNVSNVSKSLCICMARQYVPKWESYWNECKWDSKNWIFIHAHRTIILLFILMYNCALKKNMFGFSRVKYVIFRDKFESEIAQFFLRPKKKLQHMIEWMNCDVSFTNLELFVITKNHVHSTNSTGHVWMQSTFRNYMCLIESIVSISMIDSKKNKTYPLQLSKISWTKIDKTE